MSSTRKKPRIFLHVQLKGNPEYEAIHRICSTIEILVRSIVPNARIAIRSETAARGLDDIWSTVKKIAEEESQSRGAHNIHVKTEGEKLGVDFVLQVSAGLNAKQAHEVSSRVERRVMESHLKIGRVIIHEESVSELVSSELSGHGTEIKLYVEHVVARFPELQLIQKPVIRWVGESFYVSLAATSKPEISMQRINEVASQLESALKQGYASIQRVVVSVDSAPLVVHA
jgi:divalent metal cation (Fe/Co/Zn/Cd) transporter